MDANNLASVCVLPVLTLSTACSFYLLTSTTLVKADRTFAAPCTSAYILRMMCSYWYAKCYFLSMRKSEKFYFDVFEVNFEVLLVPLTINPLEIQGVPKVFYTFLCRLKALNDAIFYKFTNQRNRHLILHTTQHVTACLTSSYGVCHRRCSRVLLLVASQVDLGWSLILVYPNSVSVQTITV